MELIGNQFSIKIRFNIYRLIRSYDLTFDSCSSLPILNFKNREFFNQKSHQFEIFSFY